MLAIAQQQELYENSTQTIQKSPDFSRALVTVPQSTHLCVKIKTASSLLLCYG